MDPPEKDLAEKDPNATLDFRRNWAVWLPDGDTIVTSTWIVPAGLTKTNESHTDTTATVWLSGGTVDQLYTITNRITTVQNRTDDRSLLVIVRER